MNLAGRAPPPGFFAATFRLLLGFGGVKTFLKVLLGVVGAIIAIKLLPRIIGLGFGLVGALIGLAAAGIAMVAAVFSGAIALVVVLAPLWLPVLAIVGIVALCRRKKEVFAGAKT
jgi:hypothetical protein